MTLTRRSLLASAAMFAAMFAVVAPAGLASAAPAPGTPAPVFTATDTMGVPVDLAALKGRTVVLEWTNHDCPFVRKHYGAGNMQAIQKAATADGVVWISVISSAPGTQGHVSAERANELTRSRAAAPSHVVLDPEGRIGRLYGAQVTPHMYVLSPEGEIAYMGGIDDKPTANPADIEGATNYVLDALEAVKAGRTPSVQAARPYGCSVRYAS